MASSNQNYIMKIMKIMCMPENSALKKAGDGDGEANSGGGGVGEGLTGEEVMPVWREWGRGGTSLTSLRPKRKRKEKLQAADYPKTFALPCLSSCP